MSGAGTDLGRALKTARAAAAGATELLQSVRDVGSIATKSNPRDLVTVWDKRAEEVIRAALAAGTPEIPILGEEQGGGDVAAAGALRWLVDPIDGTVNFTHGLPLYAVSIGLEAAGEPLVGVVTAPALNWEFWGQKGGGAFFNGQRMQVSAVATLEGAALATGFAYDRAQSRHNFAEWERFQCAAGACRRFGAAALDLAFVARGWLDGYWETRLSPWDLCAGVLLVREAGGRVTNLTGGTFASQSGDAVASNGVIHDQMLAVLRAR